MENHVRLLGLLTISVGVLNGLAAIFQFFFFGGAFIMSIHLGVNVVAASVWLWTALALMLPSIVIGIALLSFRDWARVLGIILSVCEMLLLPLGTIVGMYGLYVLFSESADMIFERRYGEYSNTRR